MIRIILEGTLILDLNDLSKNVEIKIMFNNNNIITVA